jgi:FkbM family methyltransferase
LKSLLHDNPVTLPIKRVLRKAGVFGAVQHFYLFHVIHDEVTMTRIRKLVNKDDAVIVEIGANIGQHTTQFAATFPNGKIFCFEPDKRNLLVLKKAIKHCKNVVCIEKAVGARSRRVAFYQSTGRMVEGNEGKEWTCSSSIKTPTAAFNKTYPAISFKKAVSTACIRLDTWYAHQDLGVIDFVWMDVEGAEGDVIRGGAKTFRDHVRYLYTEYSDDMWEHQMTLADIRAALPSFRPVGYYGNNILLRNVNL